MGRRRRTGEIEHFVDLQPLGPQAGRQRLDDVAVDQIETRLALEMAEVLLSSGLEIVEGDDVSAFTQKSIAQVRPEETGAARNEDVLAFAILHEDDLLTRPPTTVPRYKPSLVQR
jgi:hypothetical protein